MSGGFLQKDENQDWNLFEDLAEKTLQWEPASEKPRNSQSIASRGGLLSLELSITAEAKIAILIEENRGSRKKRASQCQPNQPPPIHNPGCSYCQASNHVFEECPVFHTQQVPPEHLNAAYSRPPHNSYFQISLGPRTILLSLISQTIFTIPVLHQIFPVKLHFLLSKFTNGK